MINYYVVSYVSLHEGEMKQVQVSAKSALEAKNFFLETDFETEEELERHIQGSDAYIGALEL